MALEQKVALDDAAKASAKRYLNALGRGRKATVSKNYPAAIAAFDEALALRKSDARSLAERGFAKYSAGDLPGAKRDFDAAARLSSDKKLSAQIAFNESRVAKAQGNDAEIKQLSAAASVLGAPNATCPVVIEQPKTGAQRVPGMAELWARLAKDHQGTFAGDTLDTPRVAATDSADAINTALTGEKSAADGLWAVSLQGMGRTWHAFGRVKGKLWLLPMLGTSDLSDRCPFGAQNVQVSMTDLPRVEVEEQMASTELMCQKPNGDIAECDGSDTQGDPVQAFCKPGTYALTTWLLDPADFSARLVLKETGMDSEERADKHSLVHTTFTAHSVEVTAAGCQLKKTWP